MVLPLIAYFISRNDSSKGLGGMILVAGILIIIGAVTVIGMTDLSEADETARNPLMEAAPLLIVGGIQMGLGVLKIKKS
jgi:amino acid transporter